MAGYQLNPPLLCACRDEKIRRRILTHLSTHDICTLRLTSCAFSNMVTSSLFTKIRLSFSPSAFSRQCRIEALSRIGHHVKHFTFSMRHSEATFLPPLLNPKTGMEIGFMYTPHTSLESEKERPKYGSSELGSYLTAQYPAIFHAATNVPAFIRALGCMANIEHISISCPDQEPDERYRRSAVDYALISLRIAIERADLPHLSKLSLACHPAALLYLHPTPNFGASPSALRKWRRIKNLKLSIDAWPFGNAPTDHLKLLANYLRVFAGTIEKLTFHWYGQRGPCPLTMAYPTSRPCSPSSSFCNSAVSPASTSQKLFAEITSPMSPLPLTPSATPLHFEKLRRFQIRNTHVTPDQVSSFITRHASSIKGMDFDNVVLASGTWDDALLPLGRLSSREAIWEARHSGSFTGTDVDLISCGFSITTPIEEEEKPYSWQPKTKQVVEDERRPLRESFVEAHMASMPSHVNIAKKYRRRRHRRTASPPSPPPSLRHQASHLLGKLKKEASQSSFLSMFKHHDSASSTGSLHSIKKVEPEDDHIFLATPRHNREMPSVPTKQDDYFDLGEHDFSVHLQPAYEPALETLLQPKTYAAPITPPRTPTKGLSEGTPRSKIWEFDRPSSLIAISEAEATLLSNKTYSSGKADSRHPLDRQPTVEDVPLMPSESPIHVLSPSVYTPPSSLKSTSPCRQRQEREQQAEERIRGQPVQPLVKNTRPPMVKLSALTPMLESIRTPITPWPTSLHRSCTPMPLKIDTNISPIRRPQVPTQFHAHKGMDVKIQGNQRDITREDRYVELANDTDKRDQVLKTARERVMGRLGRKYSGKNPSTTSLSSQSAVMGRARQVHIGYGHVKEEKGDMVRGGQVQDDVRREMWSGCGDEFAADMRESEMRGGKERSVLVPFMILR